MLESEAREATHFRFVNGEWWYYPPSGVRSRAVTGTCKWCGGAFVRTRSGGRSYEFCGNECYRAWRKEQRTVACKTCDEEFQRGERSQKYCSHECYTEDNQGENHANYKGYVTTNGRYRMFTRQHPEHPGRLVHQVVFEECHGYSTCAKCGVAEVEHVHHRDEDGLNNDPENLVGLCAPCHIRHHLSSDPDTEVRA